MNKNTILTALVVVLFGASGLIVYYGVFQKPGTASIPIDINQKNIVELLPYGENLNFEILEDRTNVQPPFVYKKVNPSQDVGLEVRDIIKNANLEGSGGGPNQIF